MRFSVHARLRRVRAKVPSHQLFFKIFLWFWLTALGMFVMIWLGFRFTGLKEIAAPNLYATVAPVLAAEAVHAYESGGPQEFARFTQSNVDDQEKHLYLLDGFYKDVLSRPVTKEGVRTARAAKLGHLVIFRGHIAAYKSISPTGRPYTLVLYTRNGFGEARYFLLGKGFPFAISMFLMASVFSFWLAHHIASPIHSIQSAARRVAEGDLVARVPSAVSKRHDELAALAIDFDSMVDRLEVLIRMQKDLLSSVSHEVRSPLARINLCLAILKNRWSTDSDDVLYRMESEIDRIDLLMGQLLMLSRLEAGLSSTVREEVNLGQILEEVTADGNFEARALGKSVSLRMVDNVLVKNADPHALRSAFENIVRNAVRFTRPGTDVEVVLEMDGSALQPCAFLYVRDYGPGVPEGSLQEIFQPFVQVMREGIPEKGNGLGLAIALQAIRIHAGTISAANLPRGGLEICVQLPASYSSADSARESLMA